MRLISVTGPIGSGKSTLCEALGHIVDAPIIKEEFSLNPYLAIYYSDRKTYALASQIWFLLRRYEQLTVGLFNKKAKVVIQDQTLAAFGCIFPRFFRSRGYLTDKELLTLESLHAELKERLPKFEEITLFCVSPADLLIKRVNQRGREYEKSIDQTYLNDLTSHYHKFYDEQGTKLVVCNTVIQAEEIADGIVKEYL